MKKKLSIWNFFIKIDSVKLKFLKEIFKHIKGLQGQWNVIKLGNPVHAGQCKQQRFKNIRIEAIDPTAPRTIPIMTDGVINVSLLSGND